MTTSSWDSIERRYVPRDTLAEQTFGDLEQYSQGITYLGSPYSKYKQGHDAAARIAAKAAAMLMRRGEVVYSPIAHGHAVAQFGLPLEWDFWKAQCLPMLRAASKMVVLQMDGWDESVGLQFEIGECRRTGKPIEYLSLDEVVLDV